MEFHGKLVTVRSKRITYIKSGNFVKAQKFKFSTIKMVITQQAILADFFTYLLGTNTKQIMLAENTCIAKKHTLKDGFTLFFTGRS
uniref:Uncharacterized protein n=1 Tax=Arundo donax TaxID=35708 RepID=A0A0A9AX17_ARUDO